MYEDYFLLLVGINSDFLCLFSMSCSHNNGTASSAICVSSASGSPAIAERSRPGPEEASPPEVLGSVVHCQEQENGDKNCFIQLRTSARVSKKLRLDSLANQAAPEKKGEDNCKDMH